MAEFQLNTIQRLTETRSVFVYNIIAKDVPIKHYPTINWNSYPPRHQQTALDVPIKHYPTINWNVMFIEPRVCVCPFQLNTIQRLTETSRRQVCRFRYQVPIKHYPTINWNVYVVSVLNV